MNAQYENLKKYLIDNLIARQCDIEGAAEDKILFLEDEIGLNLPKDYKFFLKKMGKKAGIFYNGEFIFEDKFPTLITLSKKMSNKLFNEKKEPRFVFWSFYEEDFLYFLLDGSDYPQIYYFSYSQDRDVREKGGVKENISFWEILMCRAQETAKTTKNRDPSWLDEWARTIEVEEKEYGEAEDAYREEYENYRKGENKLNEF